MKIIVNSYELLKALKTVKKATGSDKSIPMLQNIYFDIKNGILTLKAYDNETYLTFEMSLESSNGIGVFALNPNWLLKLLQEIENENIELDFTDWNVNLITSRGEYNFPFDSDDYNVIPQTPIVENKLVGVISSDTLLVGLNKTIYAASTDELRPQMSGVFCELGNEMSFVGTDSHKLAVYTSKPKEPIETSFIIPLKSADILRGLLSNHSNVTIEVGKYKNRTIVLFKIEDYRVFIHVMEGSQFPEYKKVIPFNDIFVKLDKSDFIASLRRVAVCSNQASKLVKLTFDNCTLKLEAKDIDFSTSAFERISCDYSLNDAFVIGFKSELLLQALSSIATKEVLLELAGAQKPCIVKPVASEISEFVLVMPMYID